MFSIRRCIKKTWLIIKTETSIQSSFIVLSTKVQKRIVNHIQPFALSTTIQMERMACVRWNRKSSSMDFVICCKKFMASKTRPWTRWALTRIWFQEVLLHSVGFFVIFLSRRRIWMMRVKTIRANASFVWVTLAIRSFFHADTCAYAIRVLIRCAIRLIIVRFVGHRSEHCFRFAPCKNVPVDTRILVRHSKFWPTRTATMFRLATFQFRWSKH